MRGSHYNLRWKTSDWENTGVARLTLSCQFENGYKGVNGLMHDNSTIVRVTSIKLGFNNKTPQEILRELAETTAEMRRMVDHYIAIHEEEALVDIALVGAAENETYVFIKIPAAYNDYKSIKRLYAYNPTNVRLTIAWYSKERLASFLESCDTLNANTLEKHTETKVEALLIDPSKEMARAHAMELAAWNPNTTVFQTDDGRYLVQQPASPATPTQEKPTSITVIVHHPNGQDIEVRAPSRFKKGATAHIARASTTDEPDVTRLGHRLLPDELPWCEPNQFPFTPPNLPKLEAWLGARQGKTRQMPESVHRELILAVAHSKQQVKNSDVGDLEGKNYLGSIAQRHEKWDLTLHGHKLIIEKSANTMPVLLTRSLVELITHHLLLSSLPQPAYRAKVFKLKREVADEINHVCAQSKKWMTKI